MKTKSFKQYLKKRLDKQEIKKIERSAQVELDALKISQANISKQKINNHI